MVVSVWCMTLRQCELALSWRRRLVEACRGTQHEAAMAAVWKPDIDRLEKRQAELLAWRDWRDEA